MNIGFGFSKLKEPEAALQEAYRKSIQRLGVTKADLALVFYSYDYGLDPAVWAPIFKKLLRYVPHIGCSSWSAWNSKEAFEGETGLMVVSFKSPEFKFNFLKVHSLREKADLWSAEVVRQVQDEKMEPDLLMLFADSLNFTSGEGFAYLEKNLPLTQTTGFGTSFSVPQCSVVCDGEVYVNSLVGLSLKGVEPWIGIAHNIKPELKPISINRMSENLMIEMDEKPAFYKLCEHLMTSDDLPMMAPDEFRKHMGNLFLIEEARSPAPRTRTLGAPSKSIALLGSEMTTGMVAVANALDFSKDHFLGQRKIAYAEGDAAKIVAELHQKVPHPSCIWMICSASRMRDRERVKSDFEIVRAEFPDSPMIGVSSNGELLGGINQYALIVLAFP